MTYSSVPSKIDVCLAYCHRFPMLIIVDMFDVDHRLSTHDLLLDNFPNLIGDRLCGRIAVWLCLVELVWSHGDTCKLWGSSVDSMNIMADVFVWKS